MELLEEGAGDVYEEYGLPARRRRFSGPVKSAGNAGSDSDRHIVAAGSQTAKSSANKPLNVAHTRSSDRELRLFLLVQ